MARTRYLISAGGIPNFGDELIQRGWLRWLAEFHPDDEVWVDCMEPPKSEALCGDLHPNLRFTDALWQLIRATRGQEYRAQSEQLDRWLSESEPVIAGVDLSPLRAAHSVHIVGGGFLNALWAENRGMIAMAAHCKRRFGAHVAGTGMGLLPGDDDDALVATDFAVFDVAEARDAPGAQRFSIPLGLDDAFLDIEKTTVARSDAPDIMVLVQGDLVSPEAVEQLDELAVQFIDAQLAAGATTVGFVESIAPVDARVWDRLRARYPQATFHPFHEIWWHGIPFKAGQRWFTTRFHFHLLAAAAEAKGVAIDVKRDYYGIKHASLTELGTGWTVSHPSERSQAPTLAANFERVARRAHRRKRAVARAVYPIPRRERLARWLNDRPV